jgi:hypothetical protein
VHTDRHPVHNWRLPLRKRNSHLFPSNPCISNAYSFTAQLKCDGTRWRKNGEAKGKLANGVGSQYSSYNLGTWYIQHYYRWMHWTDLHFFTCCHSRYTIRSRIYGYLQLKLRPSWAIVGISTPVCLWNGKHCDFLGAVHDFALRRQARRVIRKRRGTRPR